MLKVHRFTGAFCYCVTASNLYTHTHSDVYASPRERRHTQRTPRNIRAISNANVRGIFTHNHHTTSPVHNCTEIECERVVTEHTEEETPRHRESERDTCARLHVEPHNTTTPRAESLAAVRCRPLQDWQQGGGRRRDKTAPGVRICCCGIYE